jgi:hypothetical protein
VQLAGLHAAEITDRKVPDKGPDRHYWSCGFGGNPRLEKAVSGHW